MSRTNPPPRQPDNDPPVEAEAAEPPREGDDDVDETSAGGLHYPDEEKSRR